MTGRPLAVVDGLDLAPGPSERGPLDELFACLDGFLHLDTVRHVLFALAVAIGARTDRGDPLWGLIIGAASSGKTEIVRMLDSVADEHPDELTAPSLLSWSKGKDPRRVGILARLPNPGLLTVGDFSTVLATSQSGGRDQLFALLRRAHDGAVSRDLGNSERPLTWQGRLTLLAACTPVIDSYSSHADALGPRWLYCRIDGQDSGTKRATGHKALGVDQLARRRKRVATLAAEIVSTAAQDVPDTLDSAVDEALLDAAIVACYGRGAVARDGYGRREITSLASVEEPPRLTGQLALLARALLALGLDADHVVALSRRCALDSIPQPRRRALAVLAHCREATASDVAREVGCNRGVARRAMEELEAIGVVDRDDPDEAEPGARNPWALAGDDEPLIRRVMLDDERSGGLSRKLGSHSQFSQREGSDLVPPYFSGQGVDPEHAPERTDEDLARTFAEEPW